MHNTTGAGACQLNKGRTFHSAFKCGKNSRARLSASAVAFLKQLFDAAVVLVVVDEISMLKADSLVLLDERLRQLYDSDKPFGGMSILLTGDFWQLPAVRGTSLCKVMYMRTADPTLQKAKHLFSLFKVFKLQQQQRASECERQQVLLDKFRVLPEKYPVQNYWSKDDDEFRPVDRDITKELTKDDVTTDGGWLDDSTILVTSNTDRAVLNTCMAKRLSLIRGHLLFRWRKPLMTQVPEPIEQVIYNEDEHPELFGYFFYNAPGQILDNANGNVGLGVANGTRCWYHSLGWDDEQRTAEVMSLIEDALKQGWAVVDLPFPPQFINVRLADRDGRPLPAATWPTGLALDCSGAGESGQDGVVIPVTYVLSNGENYAIDLGLESSKNIYYAQHAVDLAMVLTVWKAQGATFGRVILLLEGSQNAPAWKFEHVYVAVSRVKSTQMLRCFPLSPGFKRAPLYRLRPNVFTIKWFMDIGDDGMWRPHSEST